MAHDNNCGGCDCKAIHGVHGDYDRNKCEFDCDCMHQNQNNVSDPDEDLDRRIADSVEKAISDILSDVVNRCISTSLKGCIEI